MAIAEGFFAWFSSLQPPDHAEGLSATHVDHIVKPYAKGVQDCGTYYRIICPRAFPHGSHTTSDQESDPSCIVYKHSGGFGTDFHIPRDDAQFNIPPFELWCLLKYGGFNPTTDRSRYPEFCEELGILPKGLQPAVDLIAAWAAQKFLFQFHDKWQIYSKALGQYVTVAIFNQAFDMVILERLRTQAQECNPPHVRRRYTIDKMPAFYKAWASAAFHLMLTQLQGREQISPDQLPTDEQELVRFRLQALLHKSIMFSFREGRPFTSTLWAMAGTIQPGGGWTAFDDYECWFQMDTLDGTEQLLVAITFGLLLQLDREWAKEFRTNPHFVRYISGLQLGREQAVHIGSRMKTAVVLSAASLHLDAAPPSSSIDQALEHLGELAEDEDRFTK